MPISITKENFDQEVTQSTLPVVLDVYASWCGPCQQMTPILEALEKELKERYKFAKLNVDEARDISIRFGVTSVPTFLYFKEDEVKGRDTGYMSKEDLQARIEEILG